MKLVKFDATQAATVANWPTSTAESVQWCGRDEVPPDMVASWSADNDVQSFTLMDADEPIGYGELWLDDDEDEVELARLIVAPTRRGRGAGRYLVEALTDLARQRKPALIALRVHPDNARAAQVYLAAGYTEVDDATAAEWNTQQPFTYRWMSTQ